MFYVVDSIHSEYSKGFTTFENAETEIRRRCAFPWNCPPNRAPCRNWETCGREYLIIEIDDSNPDDILRAKTKVCDLRESGIVWHGDFGKR